jgi:hypothetical protein
MAVLQNEPILVTAASPTRVGLAVLGLRCLVAPLAWINPVNPCMTW